MMKQTPFQLLIILICIFFYNICNAQEKENNLLAIRYDSIAENHYDHARYDNSLIYYKKALPLFSQSKNWTGALQSINMISYCYFINNEIPQMGAFLIQNEKIAEELSMQNPLDERLVKYWNLLGIYYFKLGNLHEKINCDKKALYIQENTKSVDFTTLALLYQNIAFNYSKLRDHKTALEYSLNAHAIYVPDKDRSPWRDSLSFINTIATQYAKLNNEKESNFYFNKVKKLLKHNSNSESVQKTELMVYLNLKKYFPEYELKKPIINFLSPAEKSTLLRNSGKYYIQKQDKTKALQLLQSSLTICIDSIGLKSSHTSNSFLALGDFHQTTNQEQAISFYQKALTSIVLDFNESIDIAANPSLDLICFSKPRLLEILIAKAKALRRNKNTALALKTYNLAIELKEDLQQTYLADASKLKLQENNFFLFEEAIQLAITLGDHHRALAIAERSKATLLQETIADIRSKKLADIPDYLRQQEQVFKQTRGYLERQLFTAKQTDDEEYINQLQAQLFDTKRAYEKLKQSLLQEYPRYYELKHQKQNLDIASIKSGLKNDQAIIEYFYGQDTIYTFVITKNKLLVHKDPTSERLLSQINSFRDLTKNYSGDVDNFISFANVADSLYQILVKLPLNNLSKEVKYIRIIPDGPIAYIPFQALIKKPLLVNQNGDSRFDTLHYLVKDYCFSYDYSLTLAKTFKDISTIKYDSDFGGFAPVFEGDPAVIRDGELLQQLLASIREVQIIDTIIGGQIYLRDTATTDQFKNNTQSHKILHLATHAFIDDASPMNTRIHFRDDFFTLNDIYGLPIQARLAVLSACETGTGALQKGEGVMSLARAFMYAGCPSILTSLWQVDDQKTADLMIDFYKNLKEGNTQDQALQQAQQHYLSNLNAAFEGHPSYWAAFIHIGQQDALFDKGNSYKYVYWLAGLLVLALLLFFGMRFKKG